VKPETADCLTKARECLDGAKQIAELPLPQVAAREAYLAAFHAAEAYIFEETSKTVKTHRGLRTTFSRLARNEPRISPEYLTFLARAYELKSIADYGVGPAARPITGDDAARAIETAERYIDTIAQLLTPGPTPPRGSNPPPSS
jgi:uncharacterized protein (UPF0332 family)